MGYNNEYYEYVTAEERRRKAAAAAEKLKKKTPDLSPVIIEGRKLAKTWWGESWNKNLESYADYSSRIGRGKTYARNGAVLDLKIVKGNINALVQGSRTRPYKINIKIAPLSPAIWKNIIKDCAGKFDSLQELLEGKFPKALSDLFTSRGKGLFPAPNEISFDCSCPDWADMCKHVAAVLYGVGARLDEDPSLFFVLRNVEVEELISKTITEKSETLLGKSENRTGRVIEDIDISGIFGIEFESAADEAIQEVAIEKVTEKKKRGRPRKNG